MADLPTKPISRLEQFYNAIATGDASQLPTPITREEAYLAFIAENGGGGGGGDLSTAIIADLFDSSSTYSPGDYVTYGGNLYQFINDHAGAWDDADVVQTTVGDEIEALAKSARAMADAEIATENGAHGFRYYDEEFQYSTTAYSAVTPTGTENPKEQGWYVLVDGEYELTIDETVVAGTTYYSATITWHTIETGGTNELYIDSQGFISINYDNVPIIN